MKAPRRLDTERLILIAPTAGDADEIFERYASDPEVTRELVRHHELSESCTRFRAGGAVL